jgi:hypothetical protein
MVAISALPVRHHHVEHAVITPTNHSVLRVHRKWQHHRQSQCTATGEARDKAGGKPHSADKGQRFDRSPRRLRSRAFPSIALRHSHPTGRLRPKAGVSPKIICERIGPDTDASR